MAKPTFFEPVKTSPETLGLATRVFPIGARVGEVAKAPAGRPASRRISRSFNPVVDASGEGLKTTVFPARSAPADIPAARARGKLKGAMTPKTPEGFRMSRVLSP